jgi:predicted permease
LVAGLSIAVNTTVFSVVSAVLLRAPAFPQPERLVRLWFGTPNDRAGRATRTDLERWTLGTGAFEHLTAYRPGVRTFATAGGTGRGLPVAEVSSSFFDVLRVFPTAGRAFRVEDEEPDATPVALVSPDLWGGMPGEASAGGRSILLDGVPHHVVGVMPAGFAFPDRSTRVWIPLRRARAPVATPGLVITSMETVLGLGRLKHGVSLAQALTDGRAVFPAADPRYSPQVGSVIEVDSRAVRGALLLLQVAVLLVLVIACTNIAHLLLARAVERKPEFAVRMALGASRYRLMRQWAIEGVLLAASGGVVGLVLTGWSTRWLRGAVPPAIGSRGDIGLDPSVIAFCVGATASVAVLTVIIPGLQTRRWKPEDMDLWRKSAGAAVTGRNRTRRLLIGGQFALALALLVTTVAVTRSFANLAGIDSGYDVDGVAMAQLRIPEVRYANPAARAQLLVDVLTMASGIPGLRGFALANHFPLIEQQFFTFSIPGNDGPSLGRRQVVSDAYFRTLGIRLVRGRGLEPGDTVGAPPVLVVSRAFAATHFGEADPLDQMIVANGKRWTVVGVAEDVRGGKLTDPAWPGVYVSFRQLGDGSADRAPRLSRVLLFARADQGAVAGLTTLERRLQAHDPALALDDISPLAQRLDLAVAVPRFVAAVMLAFSALSVLLAGLGVSGMVAYAVAQRIPEFGLRLALGATPKDIYLDIMRLVGSPLVAGAAVGILCGSWLLRAFRALLYGVSPFDVTPLLGSVGVLVACALLACAPAARRALSADPAVVLRQN